MNMKKVLTIMLLGTMVASNCLGQNPTAVYEYSYCIRNNTPTSKTQVIPVTSIRPKIDKLTAYVVTPIQSSAESAIAVFDDTTVRCTGEKLGEKESLRGGSAGERFKRPKEIANGVVVHQGAFTDAIIFFIRE